MANKVNVTGLQKRSIINDTVTTQDTTFSSTEIVRRLGQIESGSGLQALDMNLVDELQNNANLNNLQAGTAFATSGQTLLNAPSIYGPNAKAVFHTTVIDENNGHQEARIQKEITGTIAPLSIEPFASPLRITRLPNPALFNEGGGFGIAFSPNGRYMTVAHLNSPFMAIYDWISGVPVKLPSPNVLPTGSGSGVAWSPDNRYMTIGHNTTPFMTIYDWISGVPVALPNPDVLPTGAVNGIAWSSDARYMVAAHNTAPFLSIYDWISGTPVRIGNPDILPTGNGRDAAWSPDNRYMVIAHATSPFLSIYDWISGVPVRIDNPDELPSNNCSGVAWSHNGRYLTLAHTTTPFMSTYDWESGSPVRIPNPASIPAGNGNGVAWSSDDRYLVIAHATLPHMSIYDWESGYPVKIPNPAILPPGSGNSVAWSPDDGLLAIAITLHAGATIPGFVMYEVNRNIQLESPINLSAADNILTFNAVPDATGYRIYANGNPISGVITETSFDLSGLGLTEGTHNIQVRAIGDGQFWLNSELSTTVNFVVPPPPPIILPAPTNLVIVDGLLTWQDVPEANGFRIYANMLAISGILTTVEFDLSTVILQSGTYDIQVRSIGDGVNWDNSALSVAVEFYVEKPYIPMPPDGVPRNINILFRVKIEGAWMPWESAGNEGAGISQQQVDEIKQDILVALNDNSLTAIDVDDILDDILV